MSVVVENGVALVTLNRPHQMNALSADLRAALSQHFATLATNDAVRVVILTGAGERAFCAGLDLKELGSGNPSRIVEEVDNPVAALTRFAKPIIGAINGVAITGGFELALGCDILIASTNARFADTHARVGILPGWGLSQKLSRMIGLSRAMELSLSGNFLDAQTALSWGLVNRVVAHGELLDTARRLASDIAQLPTDLLASYKRLIVDGFTLSFGEAVALEQARAAAFNAGVTAEAIEARRAEIQARGRKQ